MTQVRLTLVALPVATLLLTWYAVRPTGPVTAPRRLAAARAAVLVAGFAVASVEVLSGLHALTPAGVVVAWLAALVAAGAGAALVRRRGRDAATAAAAPADPPDRPERPAPADPPDRPDRPERPAPAHPLDRPERPAPADPPDRLDPPARPGPPDGPASPWRPAASAAGYLRSAGRGERAAVLTIGLLFLAELVLALASPPNTYDSQTYHLPRIEHWVQQGSVELFPTGIHRQITYPPGAEFLLIHLRLLTGTDLLYNLVQWGTGVLCVLLVTRVAAQFGVGRRGQLLGALVVASVPMVVLQSSSTQTDLIVAAWVMCVATLVLDGVGREPARRPGPATYLLLGIATGLVAVTKATGGLAVVPLLVWWGLAQLRRGFAAGGRRWRAVGRMAVAALLVGVATAALAGPQLLRVYRVFDHPLGPELLRNSLTMQRHDPASVLVNGLRQAHTLWAVPAPPVNRWAADRVIALALALDRDPSDPKTTFYQETFPTEAWYPHEDKAALPLHALLLVIGAVAALRHRVDRRRAAYVAVLAIATVAYVVTFRWQPWGNRLVVFLIMLAGPLAGAWLDGVLSGGRRALRVAAIGTLAVAALAGGLSAAYGHPRRLLGADSALVADDASARFAIRPAWETGYRTAADAVRGSGARRVGMVALNDNWEYPWWVLLDGRELRSLQSPVPSRLRPATVAEVDAVVCAAPLWFCASYFPPGWASWHDGVVGYALPPAA